MWQPADAMQALDRMLDSPAATAMALVTLLAVPVVASSDVVSAIESHAALRADVHAYGNEGATSHQMRCWQQGRLLFEQNLTALPADDARYTLRLSGNDGQGRPVYVAETGNATCLIRSMVDGAHGQAG